MFKFNKRDAKPSQFDALHSVMPMSANSSKPISDVQRELVLLAFKDTMRHSGIPMEWLSCVVRASMFAADGEPPVQIILQMNHWSGHLLRYACAFEQQFIECLNRYEPSVDHSKYEWVWKYGSKCQSPFPVMPDQDEWVQKLEASRRKRPALSH